MGLPLDALATVANDQLNADFFDAPLRLQAETYESFAQRLNVNGGQDGNTQTSVAEELRRLQIDPEIFYANAQRLGVRDYCADDLDPTSGPSGSSMPASLPPPTPATLAALLASGADPLPELGAAGDGVSEAPAASATNCAGTFEPPARGLHSTSAEPIDASRQEEIESYHIETDADNRLRMCGLHVPAGELVEEIALDGVEEEQTLGGRLNSETPSGLEAKLQIDSLTDDEDEEDFLTTSADGPARPADEEDEVEAFSLDPDFDYDKVDNLTRRL